jgi:hypothetical protein
MHLRRLSGSLFLLASLFLCLQVVSDSYRFPKHLAMLVGFVQYPNAFHVATLIARLNYAELMAVGSTGFCQFVENSLDMFLGIRYDSLI